MIASRGRRRIGFGVVFLMVIGVGFAAWLVGSRVQSPAQAAARAAPPEASWVTAAVERRVLASTVITRGEIRPVTSTPVLGPSTAAGADTSSAGIVTGLWVAVGDDVVAGDRVVEVSGRPVFVFEGSTPSYRAMRPGMSGADVIQLQVGLVALGCAAGDSGTYDDATKACVETMYSDAGYPVVRGSDSEIADLGDAEAAVAAAADELEMAEAALIAAEKPADPAEVAAAERALAEATRAHDNAVADAPTTIDTATGSFDEALRALNALLASSDPASASAAAPADAAGAAPGDTSGTGGSPVGGVGQRDAAWTLLIERQRAVAAADREAATSVATAEEAVATATDALAALQTPSATDVELLAVDQRQEALARAEHHLAELEAVSGAVVPMGEVVFVRELPSRVGSVAGAIGTTAAAGSPTGEPSSGGGAGGGALVVLASSSLEASISLTQSVRPLVHEDMEVELLDEVSGETVVGTVASITDRPTSTGSAPAAYSALVEADLPEAWTGRNVRATLTSASTDHEVLVVPAAAVSSAADGTTRVRVEQTGGTIETIEVHVGLSADGFVEVETSGTLEAGDRVVIGR